MMNSERPTTRSRTAKSLLALCATPVILSIVLAGCASNSGSGYKPVKGQVDPKLGVAPSPRVVGDGQPVPKGGGRAMVGKPYVVAGKRYTPRIDPDYKAVGLASWYGSAFHGRMTANGEVFDSASISAAHPTMPLPSYARITSLGTGRSIIVRVNDRGPYHSNRVLDMSQRAAELLGVKRAGVAKIQVEYVGPAPTDGDDTRYLLASYRGPKDAIPDDRPNIMVAAVESLPGVKSVLGVFGHKSEPEPAPVVRAIAAAPAKPVPVKSAPAPVLVASNEPAARPAPPINVVPPVRPVETFDYVTIASVDPADILLGGAPITVAAVGTPLPAPLSYASTPEQPSATVQPTVMFGDTVLPPLPPHVSSYAADRVSQAYDAVGDMDAGVSLGDLASRLKQRGASVDAPAVTHTAKADLLGPTIQLGVFGNEANALRVMAGLSPYGTPVVDEVTVGGRAMKRIRLTALTVNPDDAIRAAEAIGISGASVLR